MIDQTVSAMLQPGVFLTWGILGVQLGNLIVILTIVALFILALVVPMPTGKPRPSDRAGSPDVSKPSEGVVK